MKKIMWILLLVNIGFALAFLFGYSGSWLNVAAVVTLGIAIVLMRGK